MMNNPDYSEISQRASYLPLLFAPPISFFSVIAKYNNVVFETFESFPKQTLRNRYFISSPIGSVCMTIPIEKRSNNTLTKDVRISAHENWQRKHIKTMESAYKNAAFYEFYKDDIFAIFQRRHVFLVDLSLDIMQHFCILFSIRAKMTLSTTYKKTLSGNEIDLRTEMNYRRPEDAHVIHDLTYHQVFIEQTGFIKNLSIIDFLFNEGHDAQIKRI